ncbi:hypothetical protein FB451DRAFT_1181818 [Mycena latifolia]|nr:hypothetical protein FB451DRAFT_1181818 [Mycena latifolia]
MSNFPCTAKRPRSARLFLFWALAEKMTCMGAYWVDKRLYKDNLECAQNSFPDTNAEQPELRFACSAGSPSTRDCRRKNQGSHSGLNLPYQARYADDDGASDTALGIADSGYIGLMFRGPSVRGLPGFYVNSNCRKYF